MNLLYYLSNPRFSIEIIFCRTIGRWLADKQYISTIYKLRFRRKLNWDKPLSFNEKLNWEKLYDRRKLYSLLADKYAVKQYVSERIGKEYVVENYGVFDHWDDIDFNKIPDQFVMKCTHDSGGAFICRSKKDFDSSSVRKRIEKNQASNFYITNREWPYLNITPRIIIDRLLDDHTGKELRDYKFWCFNGRPMYMYCTIKGENVFENFYDMDFNPVMIDHGFPRHKPEFDCPQNFSLMKELATKLSEGIPFVRVDFFDVEGRVYFGEFTFYDWGGLRPFGGDWDNKLGELIELPEKCNEDIEK